MISRIANHLRGNVVGYVALFAALGGTSYAAVSLAPGSVTTRALANGAVTHAKLGPGSVAGNNLRTHSLTAAAFQPGALAKAIHSATGPSGRPGVNGHNGAGGAAGPAGPAGPAGQNGSASIVATARSTGSVTAGPGASTNVPLSGGSWTQAGNDLNLITGSMNLGIPASCTGSFGNELVVSVDGTPNTFAVAATSPASASITVPFAVSEVMEPGTSSHHTVTAALANTCSGSKQDYTVSNVKVDVLNFH